MTLEPYTVVEMMTDRYRDRDVLRGAVGTILAVYGDEAYEVDFSREDGTTIAWFAVLQTEVRPFTQGDRLSFPPRQESA